MCGICGVIGGDPTRLEQSVRRMMAVMKHRGPDDDGFERLALGDDTAVGFGFRRLSILDLSPAGHQPMRNASTGDCLVFNGEIYNFRAVRRDLEQEGISFRSTGDTEVLLQALSAWGEAALERLEGMYALAFYDARARRVLLARDPLGIKPLYVADVGDSFVFASEVRGMLASGLVSREIDVGGVAGMLAYGAVQSPRTVYRQVRQFPEGSFQWVDSPARRADAMAGPRRFWSFPAVTVADDRPLAAERVRHLLRASISKHLVADVPVGVFLSAGIDSTIIASYAREYSTRVKAFTVGFGRTHGEDEVAIAAATAGALGIEHVTVTIDGKNLPSQWQDWIVSTDSPSVDGFNTYVVSRRLAQEGVVVGLSGLGADEVFGGYPTFRRAPRLARLLQALSFMSPALRSGVVRGMGSLVGSPAAVEKFADLMAGGGNVADVTRSLRRAMADRWLQSMGLAASSVGLRPNYLEDDGASGVDLDGFNAVARAEASHYMRDTLLRDTDVNSMWHSLEVRVPFLDRPLVDYVSSLPGTTKAGGGRTKPLLREAVSELLPPAVANRRKTGFSLPIGDWMRGAMRESCEAGIERVCQLPFVQADAVEQVWRRFLLRPRSMHWSRPLALVALGNSLAVHDRVAAAG